MSIATERAALFGQGLDIISRERWGAQQSYTSSRPVERARWLFLHIAVVDELDDLAGTEDDIMRNIERIGQARFGIGCSYNAAAFDSGRLYEAQPLGRRGAHTVNDKPNPAFPEGSLNHLVRALVLPQDVEDEVTDAQIDAAARWGAALCRAGFAVPGAVWYGHRDVTAKSCPGPIAYARLGELNLLTRHYEAAGLGNPLEIDDMPLNAADKDWLRDLATEIAGVRKESAEGAPHGSQRRDSWRWSREAAVHGRKAVAELAALRSAVSQLGAGGSIDYGKVQAAAADAVRDVLGSLDE